MKTFGIIKLYRIYLCFCFEKYIGYTEKFRNYQNISNIFLENIPDSSENFQNKVDASRRAEKCRSLRVKVEVGVPGCA